MPTHASLLGDPAPVGVGAANGEEQRGPPGMMGRRGVVTTHLTVAAAWMVSLMVVSGHAQGPAPAARPQSTSPLTGASTGEEVYRTSCLACHGPDGAGTPRTIVGFDVALPDFTDCAFASAEADVDWQAVVHQGGRIRGLDRHMPAFGDALNADQIAAVVGYVRHFCADDGWPRGDLNFPRAMFTEKAFPENEVVYTSTVTRGGEPSAGNEVVYERRFGVRNQFEAVVPVDATRADGHWTAGIGDVAVAFRRTLIARPRSGTIAASGVEVAFPTGDADRGLGNGHHIVEPFAMVGQALPRNAFVQFHGGLEVPSDAAKGRKEAYLRSAIGFTYMADRGFGRSWSPQLEVLLARPFGGEAEWDVVPQLQVSLSKIQHVVVAGGVRIPLNGQGERHPAVVTYLLWDWFDGPFTSFWK
ncbi:MAG: cytochrome c [Vicinamibacterales bacterium]